MLKSVFIAALGLLMMAAAAPQGFAQTGGGEIQTYRAGNAFKIRQSVSMNDCKMECQGDALCQSWNFIPQTTDRNKGVCELNADNPAPQSTTCCTSGSNGSVATLTSRREGGANVRTIGAPAPKPAPAAPRYAAAQPQPYRTPVPPARPQVAPPQQVYVPRPQNMRPAPQPTPVYMAQNMPRPLPQNPAYSQRPPQNVYVPQPRAPYPPHMQPQYAPQPPQYSPQSMPQPAAPPMAQHRRYAAPITPQNQMAPMMSDRLVSGLFGAPLPEPIPAEPPAAALPQNYTYTAPVQTYVAPSAPAPQSSSLYGKLHDDTGSVSMSVPLVTAAPVTPVTQQGLDLAGAPPAY